MPAQRFLGSPTPSLAQPRDMGTPENGLFLAVFLPQYHRKPWQSPGWGKADGEVSAARHQGTVPQHLAACQAAAEGITQLTEPKSFPFISDTHTQKATDCQKPAFRSAEVFPHTPAEKRKLLDLSAPCSICRPRMAASEKNRGKLPARRRRPGKAPRSPGRAALRGETLAGEGRHTFCSLGSQVDTTNPRLGSSSGQR